MDNNNCFKLDVAKCSELRELVGLSSNIVIICHVSPDGDAVGSSLALRHVLNSLGKSAVVVTPDLLPKNLLWLPGAKEISVFTRDETKVKRLFESADLVFCLDFNDVKRIDRVASTLVDSKAKKVLIDHHLFPENFADLVFSRPESSSTCFLLYELMKVVGWGRHINRAVATCIYTGMMTDTGNFSYNSNQPELYLAIADLIGKGIDKDRIYSIVCNSNTVNRLRLNAHAVSENLRVYPEHRAALITLSTEELNRFKYEKGDTESLVNTPLSVPEIVYSVFFREEKNYIKVSTRSKGEFPVNKICEVHFNGGGHKNASGGEFYGTMEQAIEKFESIMEFYDKYLPKQR